MENIIPNILPLTSAFHIFAVIVWIGGMFFARLALQPTAMELDPTQHLKLWSRILSRFFPWVWGAAIILPLSGVGLLFMIFGSPKTVEGAHIYTMMVLGWMMIGLFCYTFFGPFHTMKQRIVQQHFPEAIQSLNQIRQAITINLLLGISISTMAVIGSYW
jgi:uncharacterized membrane protein